MPQEFKDSINILHESYFGSVYTCIVRGTTDEITSTANKFNPLIYDILPLTLEEIFIYELGVWVMNSKISLFSKAICKV